MKKGHVWRKCGFVLLVVLAIMLLTGCMMREEKVSVTNITWTYRQSIEKYVLCEESGWHLPTDATLIKKKSEVYKTIYDENGDFSKFEYRTKYYYEIWRWKFDRYEEESGEGHEPYYPKVTLEENERIGSEKEFHYIVGKNSEGDTIEYTLDKKEWAEVNPGDELVVEVSLFGHATIVSHKKAIENPFT